MFSAEAASILLCVNKKNDIHRQLEKDIPQITIHVGLPSAQLLDGFLAQQGLLCCVFDDLHSPMVASSIINDLFLVGSHHSHCNLVYTSQHIYAKGKYSRSISLNTHYNLILNSPRSFHELQILSRQIFGSTPQYSAFMQIYHKWMKDQPYRYILISCHPAVPYVFRLSTNIFPDELTILFEMDTQ